ncbi:hypothetical protein [Paracoccus methylarcula]|uniref:DUF2946 domain-containing protein n=1 Tax=Paracoccus methylarcula TaxID=72022 RepID=A0A422QYZ8_9RHOB|nr:hypothetical protein [Paracoccus methylarcula]RNF35149.1 hypothetical protein A7A09_005710 [Paracoccus methylarcula]
MRFVLRLVLILCLTLTGVGLGVARGTVQSDGQVVICTGEGVVIRHVPGAPGKSKAHICPDMALSLLGAPVMPDASVMRDPLQRRLVMLIDSAPGVSRPVPTASARDPPQGLATI